MVNSLKTKWEVPCSLLGECHTCGTCGMYEPWHSHEPQDQTPRAWHAILLLATNATSSSSDYCC